MLDVIREIRTEYPVLGQVTIRVVSSSNITPLSVVTKTDAENRAQNSADLFSISFPRASLSLIPFERG